MSADVYKLLKPAVGRVMLSAYTVLTVLAFSNGYMHMFDAEKEILVVHTSILFSNNCHPFSLNLTDNGNTDQITYSSLILCIGMKLQYFPCV